MEHPDFPLEPSEEQRALLRDAVMAFAKRFVSERAGAPASSSATFHQYW